MKGAGGCVMKHPSTKITKTTARSPESGEKLRF